MKSQKMNVVALALVASVAVAQDQKANRVGQQHVVVPRRDVSSIVQLVADVVPLSSGPTGSINLRLRLKNVSSNLAEYSEMSPELDYDVAVFREDGTAVRRTLRGRELVES